MKISEVIRKYRKEQNLTQEQVSNYLGITASAVNKWENGISYPDITLLPPLARILKINIDTLLSFHEELTDIELNQFVREISSEISSQGYEETFAKVSLKIKEYPNCDKLILYVAQIMNGYLAMRMEEIPEKEKYQKQITAWFEMVAFGSEKELAHMAIMSLSQNYINNGEYEEAQKLLDQIPPMGFDKRTMQAKLYQRQGQYDKAYEIHERMIFEYSNCIIGSLMQMISFLRDEGKYVTAMEYANLIAATADTFHLGKYIAASSKLPIYLKEKNEEESLNALEEMINGMDIIDSVRKSKLYPHMKINEADGLSDIKKMIKRSLEVDTELDFLRDHIRFKVIVNKFAK